MKLKATLIAVQNMPRSVDFYREILDMAVEHDFGANVTLSGGLALQTLDSWTHFLDGVPVRLGGNGGELYFECDDLDGILLRLKTHRVPLVHPLKEHRWGQRVVRFFDPDGHVIEVGESLGAVVRRFAARGLAPEDIASRMDVPLDFVQDNL